MKAMPSIGSVRLGSVPRVILAVGNYVPALKTASREGVSILEARIDLFSKQDSASVLKVLGRLRGCGLPLLATFRPKQEGGAWSGSETQRKQVLLACIPQVDAVDIELDAVGINVEISKACAKAGKTLIVSKHCLTGTPETRILQRQIDAAKALGADIVKLACLAENARDVTRLLGLVELNRDKGMVGISMGPQGAVSRAGAPLFGSLITYTSRDLNYGQVALEDLVHCLEALYPAFAEDLKKRRHPRR